MQFYVLFGSMVHLPSETDNYYYSSGWEQNWDLHSQRHRTPMGKTNKNLKKKRFIHLFLNSWKTVIRIIIFITSTNEFMSFIPFFKIYILKRNSQTQSRYCFGSRNFVRAVAGICVGSDFSSFISLKNSRPCCFGLHYTVQALLYIYSAAVNLSGYNTAFCSLLFLQLRQELPSDIYLHIVSVFELSR